MTSTNLNIDFQIFLTAALSS